MGAIKGEKEFNKFINGGSLTRKEAMLAKCYDCNGGKESAQDCEIEDCPMYGYHHYRSREHT